MSQAGIVDVEGSHPQIPTLFVCNVGSAIPIANTIEILGSAVAAHSVPLQTVGSGNTINIDVQYASAAATSLATNGGVASFISTQFTVDANGFVALAGGAVTESFQVDTFTAPGTNPVVPNGSGIVTVTGGQVAAGTTTNVIRTDSLAANTYTVQIQRSQAVASSTIGDNGVSHFNSTYFTVDANGFVSINGAAIGETITGNSGGALSPTAGNWNIVGAAAAAAGTSPVNTSGSVSTLSINIQKSQAIAAADATKVGLSNFDSSKFTVDANGFVSINGSAIGETITGNSGGALSPTAGNWNILGTSTAAGTTPVQTSGSVSTLTVQIQKSQAIASTDATKVGLANFDSSSFAVDANGFVILSTTGALKTLTGNSGGTISPTANNINTVGTGSITISGSGSTLTTQLTGLTNHAVQVGAGTATLTQLAVGTNGQVLIGATTADPAFATLTSSDGSISFTTGANSLSLQVSGGSTAIKTITGNSGGAESPSAGNFNILGTGSITVAGSANTETVQLTGLTNHSIQVGAGTATLTQVGPTATAGQVLQSAGASADPAFSTATYPSTTTVSQILYSSATNVVSGLSTANRGVLTTGTTGIPVITALATDGQVIIGSTSGAPAAATLTAGTGITITNASNSITIAVNGSSVAETITGNSGGALSPTAGNWNILGSGSITTSGSVSTLTVALTGLTNHAVLVGAGTSTITNVGPTATSGQVLQSAGSSADPAFSTATYPSTTTINQILYSSATNVVSGLSTANNGVLTTGTSGIPVITALSSNGQLIIGSGSGAPTAATLTAGTGISITNGANTITIAATTSGFTWSDTSGTVTAVAENGYFITNTCTSTLPASPNEGDTVKYTVDTTNILTITANTGQKIRVGSALSASAGTAANNARGDSLELVYRSTGTTWFSQAVVGTWTVT